ncbi:MAG: hypothetical protein AB8E82_16725 [Aureispira sp.]
MKQLLLVSLCLLLAACNKEQIVETAATTTSKSNKADVIYYYKEQFYPLYLEEGSTADFVQDENFVALQQVTASSPVVTFHYSDQPLNYVYLFDSEFEGYDYMEKHDANPLLGRKFKISLRIDELREGLIAQFGEALDFKNAAIAQAAQQGVAAIYDELHINLPLPSNLEAFIGTNSDNFVRPKTGSGITSNPVLTVWEHDDAQGSEMYVEQAPNTVIWNYGAFDCFTMAANPDLTLEFQTNGNNWNDCISSKCLSYIQGADAMVEGYYKDSHFGVYDCGIRYLFIELMV